MKYRDLRGFLAGLDSDGDLRRIAEPVSTRLEMTAVSDFALRNEGPALLFEHPVGYKIPVLANLFGTTGRVAKAMGAEDLAGLRRLGVLLAHLKEPEPPRGLRDAGRLLHMAKSLWNMRPCGVCAGPCRDVSSTARRHRSRPAADSGLLAGGCRTSAHLGAGDQSRSAGGARHAAVRTSASIASRSSVPVRSSCAGSRIAAAPSTFASSPLQAGASRFRSRWLSAPIPRPCSGRSPRCRIRCPSTSSRVCCGAGAPNSSPRAWATRASVCRCRRAPRSCWRVTSRWRHRASPAAVRAACRPRRSAATCMPWKGLLATTPAITTSATGFRYSRSIGSPIARIRSITPRTPANRRTSRRCWVWR